MTTRARNSSTPASEGLPVGNLRDARKAQAQARKAEAASKSRHPAGKAMPQKAAPKPAPAKAAKPADAEKVTYGATARCGKANTRPSATPLVAALDVKIAGRRGAQFEQGVVVGFYASHEKAEQAAAEINSGKVADFSDAVVVPAKAVS